MPAIAKQGALCTGHGAYPPRANTTATVTTVTVQGVPALVEGDAWPIHTDGDSPHAGTVSPTGSTVLIEGKPAARIGDIIDGGCGSAIAEGDNTVIAG